MLLAQASNIGAGSMGQWRPDGRANCILAGKEETRNMTRLLVFSVVLVAMMASMPVAVAEDLGTYSPSNYVDATTLHIVRTLSAGWWTWTYTVHNDNVANLSLTYFSVGLIYNDTPSGTGGGHFKNYGSSLAATINEYASNAAWTDPLSQADGTNASFWFDTDFNYVAYADHQARDTGYSPDWQMRPTPSEVIPEPMSVMLGSMGLGAVAGLRRLRKK